MYYTDLDKIRPLFQDILRGTHFPKLALTNWLERCEVTHRNLRKKIGGVNQSYHITSNGKVNIDICSFGTIKTEADELYTLIPAFFDLNVYDHEDLVRPHIPYGKFQGQKWGKVINQYILRKKGKPNQRINDLLAIIGEKRYKHSEIEYDYWIHILTHPLAFMGLGHNRNIDLGSCFAYKGLNDIHKHILGQTEDTFIGFITSKQTDVNDYECHTEGARRFYGIYDHQDNVVHISNIYPQESLGNQQYALDKWASNFLELEKAVKTINKVRLIGVWQNVGTITYANNGDFSYRVEFDDTDLVQYRRCMKCRHIKPDLVLCDKNYLSCSDCLTRLGAVPCEYSGRMTFNYLSTAFDEDDEAIKICQDIRDERFFLNQDDNYYYLNEIKVLTDDGDYIPKTRVKNYNQCSRCERYCHKDHNICLNCETELLLVAA
jgi:hypothetical protein